MGRWKYRVSGDFFRMNFIMAYSHAVGDSLVDEGIMIQVGEKTIVRTQFFNR